MANLPHHHLVHPVQLLVGAGQPFEHRRCVADRHQRVAQFVAEHGEEFVLATRRLL
ncbi:MAG: hypothetical protein ABIR94_09965 [Rubrivivax sp.]